MAPRECRVDGLLAAVVLAAMVLATVALAACGSADAVDGRVTSPTTSSPTASRPIASLPAASLPAASLPAASLPIASLPAASGPVAASPATGAPSAAPAFTQRVAQLAPGVSDEASGIAISTRSPRVFFLVDDAPGTGRVMAVDADGALLAAIEVSGMSAGTAEAMSSGPCGSTPLPGAAGEKCLYVGDIGDNSSRRDSIAVFRFAEPDLSGGPAEAVVADQWRYRYPEAPQNAEAMMIDTDGSVLVVTKPGRVGSPSHRMYRGAPGGGELVLVREFRPSDAQRPLRTLFTGNVVTDLAAGPGRVVLLTYDEVQEYTAPGPAAPLSAFPDWPHHRLLLDPLPQAEGVAPAADGCGYVVASEGGPGGGNGSLAVVSCG